MQRPAAVTEGTRKRSGMPSNFRHDVHSQHCPASPADLQLARTMSVVLLQSGVPFLSGQLQVACCLLWIGVRPSVEGSYDLCGREHGKRASSAGWRLRARHRGPAAHLVIDVCVFVSGDSILFESLVMVSVSVVVSMQCTPVSLSRFVSRCVFLLVPYDILFLY